MILSTLSMAIFAFPCDHFTAVPTLSTCACFLRPSYATAEI